MGCISVMWTCYKSLVDQKLDLEASEFEGFFNCWVLKKELLICVKCIAC